HRDRRQSQRRAATEHDGEHAEPEACNEMQVNQEPHELERIEGARVGRRQERRKAQAQHGAEAERGQRDREDAADEAAAEARVVAERAVGYPHAIPRSATAPPGRDERGPGSPRGRSPFARSTWGAMSGPPTSLVARLEQAGRALAAADAHGHHAVARLAAE